MLLEEQKIFKNHFAKKLKEKVSFNRQQLFLFPWVTALK